MTENLPPAALVTGGSRGIGAAIVQRLAARGIPVVSLDREPPAAGSPARHVACDLTDLAATQAALAAITAENAILWLVNNAGIAAPASLEETTMEDFETGGGDQPARLHPCRAGGAAGDEGSGQGADRHHFQPRRPRQGAAHRLFRHQGGGDRPHPHLGAGLAPHGIT